MLQAANSASLDASAAEVRPYDFEDAANADTRVISYGEPHAPKTDPMRDMDTKVFTEEDLARVAKPARKRLTDAEARAQVAKIELSTSLKESSLRNKAKAAFNPAKSIEQLAQEDAARILGRKPLTPPEIGTMEGKPIVETIDRRGSDLGRAVGERRMSSGNMVTGTPQPADIGRIVAADTRASTNAVETPPPAPSVVGTAGKEFAERMGAALGGRKYGTAALELAKAPGSLIMDTAKGLARPALDTVKSIKAGRAVTRTSLESLANKGIMTRLVRGGLARGVGAARTGAALLGGAAGYGMMGTGALAELSALMFIHRMGQESTKARTAVPEVYREQLGSYQREGQRFGFNVKGRELDDTTLILKALVGADPKIRVQEDASLRTRFDKANRKRIRDLIKRGIVHPVATSRPVIKGRSDE